MYSKENQRTNTEQGQPLNERVESVTQNDTPQDQFGRDEEEADQYNQEEDNYQELNYDPEEEGEQETEEEIQDFEERKETSTQSHSLNYTVYSRQELVEKLNELLQSNSVPEIRRQVEVIKATFYKKLKAENEEKKKKHINEGGTPDTFTPEKDSLEEELKDLLKKYREKKAEVKKQTEEEKQKNLEKRYQLIEELKNLINKNESMDEAYREFHDIRRRWKETGPVPQNKAKYLWSTYHHHIGKFYDYVQINKELRDLDFKKNLEAKLDLCEKAEKLQEADNIVHAFNTLQSYHDQWREIGPVPPEKREEIWERFKKATHVINKRHQEYFKELRKHQNENLEAKKKLCEQAEEIAEMDIETHKDWNHYTRKILDLQKEWRKIGYAPKKYNRKVYIRFRKACDHFFGRKRMFYDQHKEWQESNLRKKQELVSRAEELKDSTDWENATRELIRLQKQWKEIGPVPKKDLDEIWNRFRSACDHFFQRKKQHAKTMDKDYEKNLEQKKDLIEKIRNFKPSGDRDKDIRQLQNIEDEWTSIGFVPYEQKDKIQQEFREAIYKQYDNLNIDDNQKEVLKYRSKLKNIKQKPKAENRMYQERDKFIKKIEKLENNILLWENNLGFISAESNEANSMIHDYQDKIEKAKKEIGVLEEKIKLIDKFDTYEE